MMKAVRLHAFGGPEVLTYEEVLAARTRARRDPDPVHAAGAGTRPTVARTGFANIPEAMRPKLRLPYIPGSDVSGVVVGLRPEATGLAEGDAVFGLVRFPDLDNGGRGYAEYATAPVAHLARKPAELDHVQAAGVPMAGLTAYQFLFDHVRLEPGKTVLVNGAAGGVGHFLVQLAKTKGASVIGVASGRHEAFLRELGVDRFVDYTTTAAEEVVRDVDHLFDTVGGPHGHRFLPVLRRGGTISPVFLANTTAIAPPSWASRSCRDRSTPTGPRWPSWPG